MDKQTTWLDLLVGDAKQAERDTRSTVMKLAADYRKLGLDQSAALRLAWQQVKAAQDEAATSAGQLLQVMQGQLGGLGQVLAGFAEGLRKIGEGVRWLLFGDGADSADALAQSSRAAAKGQQTLTKSTKAAAKAVARTVLGIDGSRVLYMHESTPVDRLSLYESGNFVLFEQVGFAADKEFRVWDLATGQDRLVFTNPPDAGDLLCVGMTQDMALLARTIDPDTDSARIEALHPLFQRFFDYVKSHDLLHAPLGRIELDGDRLFINNSEAEAVDADAQLLEAHRQYADIHVLLDGCEQIGWRPLGDVADVRQPYDAATDCALYGDRPTSWATLRPGHFAIVFPEDPHAPLVGRGHIRKAIGKVKL